MTLNQDVEIIKGHYDLLLEVGKLYRISYGIHQGIYEYVGREQDEDTSYGMHLFKNTQTREITFSYCGEISPYEFTRIVMPL